MDIKGLFTIDAKLSTNVRRWSLCFLHAICMIILSWIWIGLNFNLEIEENLVKWASIVKRNTIISSVYKDTTSLQNYSFIDVSGAKKLINRDYGQGNLVVTDRSLLDSLFRITKKYPGQYQFILCDVFFEKETDDDQRLASTLSAVAGIVFPSQIAGDRILYPVIPNIPVAYSGYTSSSGIGMTNKFLKHSLVYHDTIIGIATKMYQGITGSEIKKKWGLVWINGRPALNTSILEIRLQTADLTNADGFSKVIPLGEVLALRNDALINEIFLKDKIVVIGDFEGDLHDSIYGQMPGALLIVNMFEAIKHGDMYIKWGLLIFLLASYTAFSYIIFYRRKALVQNKLKKFSDALIGALGSRLIGYSFALYGLSIIAYFTFGIHLDILAMATYLSIISIVKKKLEPKET